MLKFIKHHMSSITDIEIFPLISFLIFFSVFVGFIIYVITMRKSTAEECANIPINDEPNQ
ncbi:CcoQ/FixQ family Cbb3-type cytochrome c oxidase assembly chaperone [Salibacter halophilus]|uniref:CcoQ/FixQ family Cbb3-type cytochrome c oxidase assembly chaperone n=2 Tax=Salibacter halophilus TaxID=1803916 RepID=A0A6N6M5C2_9FLAO|nr:CcoQ/FixQ family Cbb3-type cytochrome c oxidase assembly chaperone [Salibacter halophilus]